MPLAWGVRVQPTAILWQRFPEHDGACHFGERLGMVGVLLGTGANMSNLLALFLLGSVVKL